MSDADHDRRQIEAAKRAIDLLIELVADLRERCEVLEEKLKSATLGQR